MKAIITLMAPMSHGEFGAPTGNATQFRRIALADGRRVPAISGNALRGVMRRIVMREFLESAGLNVGSRGFDQLYAALANGGHLSGSESGLDPVYVRDLRAALPPLSLFGAALQTWMLKGRMRIGILWPRCEEAAALGLVASGAYAPGEELISEVAHVRHVDRDMQDPEISGVTPMPTTMETLITGTVLESAIDFDRNATEVEKSCVAWALKRIPALGGKSSVGFGSVRIDYDGDEGPYAAWLGSVGDDARKWLDGLVDKMTGIKKEKKSAKTPTPSAT